MNTTPAPLGQKIFRNTFFALVDLVQSKLATTLAFLILVRTLSESDIAAIGISTGYLILITYVDVAPVRIFLRDYPNFAQQPRRRDQLLTALFLFGVFEVLVLLVFYVLLSNFVLSRMNIPGLSFLYLAMLIDVIALFFQGWLKILFYADFKQSTATWIGLWGTLLRFLSYAVLLWSPSLNTYAWILIVTSILTSVGWIIVFQRSFKYRVMVTHETPRLLFDSLASYGLWNHFGQAAVSTLLLVDTVVLSWFAPISEISNYTIALRFTSLFLLISAQIERSLQVALANYASQEKQVKTLNSFLKVNFLISLAQFGFALLGGQWLIQLLFGANTSPDVYRYAIIILVGITILNITWPLLGVIKNFSSQRAAFLRVFLPVLIIGLSVYIGMAIWRGALGVAYGNIINYTLLAIAITAYALKTFPFTLQFRILTGEERDLIRQTVRGLHKKFVPHE